MKTVDKSDKGKSGIYIITNIANNKVYIGQSIDLWTRINEGYLQKLPKGKGHNVHLQRAWDKYGKDNFMFEVLEYEDNYESLNEKETYWIKKYKSSNNKYGYNILSEGGSNRGHIVSDETRRKISIATKGENNPFYGKSHSKESKESLRKSRSKPIVQLTIEGEIVKEWESKKAASEYYNISPYSIGTVLYGKTTTSKGYVWMFKDQYECNGYDKRKHFEKNQTFRAVVQLDLEGNFIKEFISSGHASKETRSQNVYNVCTGLFKSSGGYKWMFREDYEKMLDLV